jgi:hypothetical protein
MSREDSELEFTFPFNVECYAYVAIMMLKLDSNLRLLHDRIVPDFVDDEDFWRCYFYEIELIKQANGLDCLIGTKR